MNKLSNDYKMEDIIKKLEFNEKELEVVKELLNKNKNIGDKIGGNQNINMDTVKELLNDFDIHSPECEKIKEILDTKMEKIGKLTQDMQKNSSKMSSDLVKIMNNYQQSQSGMIPTDKNNKKIIYMYSSGKYKEKYIPSTNYKHEMECLLHTKEPLEINCSRLSFGPLKNKKIKVWYDPMRIGKNKIASKIVGFKVSGELVFLIENEDMHLLDFEKVKNMLQ